MRPIKTSLAALTRVAFIGLLSVIAVTIVGCGEAPTGRVPLHSVQGQITFKGQPIPGAFVTFHPKIAQEGVPTPWASVSNTGSFMLSTFNSSDGAPAGDYVVTVQWYKPIGKGADVVAGPNVIPRKYTATSTSDINVRIASGDNQLSPIGL